MLFYYLLSHSCSCLFETEFISVIKMHFHCHFAVSGGYILSWKIFIVITEIIQFFYHKKLYWNLLCFSWHNHSFVTYNIFVLVKSANFLNLCELYAINKRQKPQRKWQSSQFQSHTPYHHPSNVIVCLFENTLVQIIIFWNQNPWNMAFIIYSSHT